MAYLLIWQGSESLSKRSGKTHFQHLGRVFQWLFEIFEVLGLSVSKNPHFFRCFRGRCVCHPRSPFPVSRFWIFGLERRTLASLSALEKSSERSPWCHVNHNRWSMCKSYVKLAWMWQIVDYFFWTYLLEPKLMNISFVASFDLWGRKCWWRLWTVRCRSHCAKCLRVKRRLPPRFLGKARCSW